LDLDSTIAAIASAPGGSLRGILRLSGPDCLEIVHRLVGWAVPTTSHASCSLTTLPLPRNLGPVPVTLYVWPNASSYTRQPSVELHLPGSPPILEAALEAACKAGARLARPGEFTLRAFLAGRLDLTQAEAVLGVIDADSRRELDAALAQLAGGLARPLAALREQLLELLAHLEAGLDFVDEDIQFISPAQLQRDLAAAAEQIHNLAAQMQSRGEAGRLPRVVLLGLPNTGKSSLLNALAGDEAAIVSEVAGTTRDFLSRRVQLGDFECLLIDTAGLSSEIAANHVDHESQRAAQEQAERADLTVLCLDYSQAVTAWEQKQVEDSNHANRIVVWTKTDLAPHENLSRMPVAISTSSRTGYGLDNLRRGIAHALTTSAPDSGFVAGTADRCRESLHLAAASLHRAQALAASQAGDELIASLVRSALDDLGRILGAVHTNDLLDRIFSRFCIGK
jgi:tRNA modification GTPase